MKIDMESGAWVEMRGPEALTAGDKSAMNSATMLPMAGSDMESIASGQGSFSFSLGMIENQIYAVLANLINGWSYPYCLPKDDDSRDPDSNQPLYSESLKRLPIDDWNELEDAIQPHMAKLQGSGPKGKKASGSSASTSRARAASSPKG